MIKMLVCDFDGTLHGGAASGIGQFADYVHEQPNLRFVIATGRTFPSISLGLKEDNYPRPHSIISDVGTQIHHGHDCVLDVLWRDQLQSVWNKPVIQDVLEEVGFLGAINSRHQGDYKITFEGKLSQQQYATVAAVLEQNAIHVDLTYSHDWFLDVTPKGVNKAAAIHHLMNKHGLLPGEVCVAGDSANDTAMLTISGINAILVANHYPEVAHLSDLDNVYTSHATHAEGVLEGLKHWQHMAGDGKGRA
ncbi:sucrose phosphate synthase [Photobacterium aquae]|uniref:Sucrose phosphate synthase n=1 Tax=Photobacterium aquae TaxID=1195763 RepID=A0A0J1GVV3_9GAMM|nr:HAD-IIB family hydrolase [Photobacterium aquae]KLV03843.1 sucrose phosphate synthase [Photobacterium aquae]